jgi:hypothetical protein
VKPLQRASALIAALFLGLHLLAGLPASLEDLDSINFALGIRDYDVSRHQPHPPGYPVYMAAAKVVQAAGAAAAGVVHRPWSEAATLGLVSILGGALAVFALMALFAELDRDRRDDAWTWLAVLVVVTCPLFWLTASRPLSDAAGLAAALAVQALLVRVTGDKPLAVAAGAAGLAAGIRSQVVWLTVPMMLLTALRLPRGFRMRGVLVCAAAFVAGTLAWAIPLVWVSGGLGPYWQALSNQGAEDLSGVAMLATTPTLRQLVTALQYAFVAPWGYWQLAAPVLVLAAAGAVHFVRRAPRAFLTLLTAFGPYFVFDLLFQESVTTRYALPLVVPISYLVVRGVSMLPSIPAVGLGLTVVGFSVVIDDGLLYGFVRNEAPVFRMLDDMATRYQERGEHPVLAMHRREEFDLRRPMLWKGAAMPPIAERLPSPPKHEWLELVKYWNGGGRSPIWFVADPLRSDLALISARSRPTLYRWSFAPSVLVGGSRPSEMDWHVIDRPDWYAGEGWALTPETAGISAVEGKGPGRSPINAWIRRVPGAMNLIVGGRNLSKSGATAHVSVAVDDREVDAADVSPGFFLRVIHLDAADGPGEYAELTIAATDPDVAIEQFDARSAGEPVFGFGDGWYEHEYNPATGLDWRWASDRAVLRVRPEGRALVLTLRGELEEAKSSHLVVKAGERVVGEFDVEREFTRTLVMPANALAQPEATVTIESSAWYIPAETRWRSSDYRRLALKLFECRLSPVS